MANPPRVRVRELGISPGILPVGEHNAITDVDGVLVGHTTLIEGDSIRTGVTAIRAHPGNPFQEKVIAASSVGNGFGKTAGLMQLGELGTLESPIVLTNTLSVDTGIAGTLDWLLAQPDNDTVRSANAIVGECNDSRLNAIRSRAITREHVIHALEQAKSGPVTEGNIGGGTGMIAFGFKGGIGTSSRALPASLGGYTLGVLVQANFGGVLTIDGRRVGEQLSRYSFRESLARPGSRHTDDAGESADGSCMIIIATDAPLSARNLERVARRSFLGLARTGSFMSNGSGDVAIAFSTAIRLPHSTRATTHHFEEVRDDRISPLFLAAIEATEEAVYNALTIAETMTGHNGVTIDALPLDGWR